MNQYAACLGIDWADKKHDLCLCDTTTGKKTKLVLHALPCNYGELIDAVAQTTLKHASKRLTLRLSGSPTQLNKEARLWRVRSKRLLCGGSTT